MNRPVTMKTIAVEAGVTQATVSMCLAGNQRIPAHTRHRVQAVADRLGYRPNPYVTALMRIRRQGKTAMDRPILALINGLGAPTAWRENPAHTVRQMREGAIERAAFRGYLTQEFWLHQDGMTNDRFSEMLYARGIHGLILSPPADGAELPRLRWEHFAAVSLSVPLPGTTLSMVCNDHYFTALQAVRECHQLGYRRPGLVIREIHRERFDGRWEAGVQTAGVLVPGVTVVPTLLVKSWDELHALPGWLDRHQPDVIVTPGAEPVLTALARCGRQVPADLGLAGLACAQPSGPISGVYQNGRFIGATAVDTLVSMLERNERGLPEQAVTVMIEGEWNRGQTLRANAHHRRPGAPGAAAQVA